jgi:hypothetical protein
MHDASGHVKAQQCHNTFLSKGVYHRSQPQRSCVLDIKSCLFRCITCIFLSFICKYGTSRLHKNEAAHIGLPAAAQDKRPALACRTKPFLLPRQFPTISESDILWQLVNLVISKLALHLYPVSLPLMRQPMGSLLDLFLRKFPWPQIAIAQQKLVLGHGLV